VPSVQIIAIRLLQPEPSVAVVGGRYRVKLAGRWIDVPAHAADRRSVSQHPMN
jgi:hypothetical protein